MACLCRYRDRVHYDGEVDQIVNAAFAIDKDKMADKLSFNEFVLWKMSQKPKEKEKKHLGSGKIKEKGQNDTVYDRWAFNFYFNILI